MAHGEIDVELLVLVLLFLPYGRFFAFFFVMVMAVGLAGERNPVFGVVGASADEGSLARLAKPAIAVRGPGPGILDCSCGCGVFSAEKAIPHAPRPLGAAGAIGLR